MSRKFIEVTIIDVEGKYSADPQRALIDIDMVANVVELVDRGAKLDQRVNSIIALEAGDKSQKIYVAETFNEIRNRLAAALS